MSYGLIGHFVDIKSKKKIFSANLDFMKVFNSRRYSSEFEYIKSTSITKDEDYPEITTYFKNTLYGYYDRSVVNDPDLKDILTEDVHHKKNECDIYIVDKDTLDKVETVLMKYVHQLSNDEYMGVITDKNNENKINEKYIQIYESEWRKHNGTWYSTSDFNYAQSILKDKVKEKRDRLNKLNSLRDTKDWFEMSSEAKDRVIEEISNEESYLFDIEYAYNSIQKMNYILEFIEHDLIIDDSDDDILSYRDIEVFVEVC